MNKKGYFAEIFDMVVAGLTVAVVIILIVLLMGKFNDHIQSSNSSIFDENTKTFSAKATVKINNLDYGFGVFAVGLIIAGVIIVRNLREIKPLYVILGILLLVVLGFLGMLFENMYDAMNQNSEILNASSNLPIINFIIGNYIIYCLVFGAIITIARMTVDNEG